MDNLQMGNNNTAAEEPPKKKKCFKVALNADGFKAKEIRIRHHQNQLRVEGKQNAKTFLGTFQRSFSYTINIPAGINPKKIKTKLGPDGILRIKAKKSKPAKNGGSGGGSNDEIEVIPIKE